MTDTLRTSFRFTREETDLLCLLRKGDTAENQAVRALTGIEDVRHAPASALAHILMDAGMQAIRAKAEDLRYAELAEFLKDDPEHQAWRESRARRRLRRRERAEGGA